MSKTRLPPVNASQAIAALERAGFKVVRTEGSHRVMKKDGHFHALSIPFHRGRKLKRGLLCGLIRDAGLSVEEFVTLLHK